MKHVMPFSLDLLISWYLRLSATQSRLRVTSWCCSGQLKFYQACWDDSNVGLSGWINLVLREEQKQWHMSTFVPRPPIPPSAMQRLFFTKRVSNRYQICAKKCMEQIQTKVVEIYRWVRKICPHVFPQVIVCALQYKWCALSCNDCTFWESNAQLSISGQARTIRGIHGNNTLLLNLTEQKCLVPTSEMLVLSDPPNHCGA